MRAIIVLLLTVATAVCVSGWWLEEEVLDLRWPNCTERIKTYSRDEQQYWFNDNCDGLDNVLSYREIWPGCIGHGLEATFFNYTEYVRQFPNVDLTKRFPPPVGNLLYFPTEKEIAHINWTIN